MIASSAVVRAVVVGILLLAARISMAQESEWPVTGGDAGGSRYSSLDQINRSNVRELRPLWTYRHGDFRSGGILPDHVNKGSSFETTPIVVHGRLIFTTPYNRVIALDPESGRELWVFDPKIDLDRRFANMIINRGVAYWQSDPSDSSCSERIFLATLDARLIAIDARSGKTCVEFGKQGTVNLLDGIEPLADPWEYNETSPPTVIGDRVIVGSSIADTIRRIEPPGTVRAFDAHSGALVWQFHTIPHPGEAGADTWPADGWRMAGSANVWSTMTADPQRGLVFLPVGSAGPDFYGGDRHGQNLFADSVVALQAADGKVRWHFQTVHHDIWDYDVPAPPNLVQVTRAGHKVDAVAQVTKTGFVFVLDRDTGAPLFPVEERPVPQSDVPGEQTWPTQPIPTKPAALVPQQLSENDLWEIDPKRLQRCKEQLAKLRNDGLFTPPSERGSVLYPYTAGGANWSGAAFDPISETLFVPVNNLVHVIQLTRLADDNLETNGLVLHGGWSGLRWALFGTGTGLRYWMQRSLFKDGDVPCNRPPWGYLAAVDLSTGEIRWKVPTGEQDGVQGLKNFGSPLVTAGGLVFHAGTRDLHLRVHDSNSGAVLATFPIPAGLHAGPITYKLRPNGKQILVIAPGGHVGLGSTLGDYVMAYALPDAPVTKQEEP